MTDDDSTAGGSQAAAPLSLGQAQMPLGARRLVLIASVAVLAGVLAGRFYFGGLVLASAGTTLLAVALSYQPGKFWLSRWSWLVLAAGALWTMATAGYWWLVDAAAAASSGPPEAASLLFYLGFGALVVMLGAVLLAAILRAAGARRRRRP